MDQPTITAEYRYRATKRNTLIGAFLNLILAVVAIGVGFFHHSQALIADGIHSLSDLLGDILVLFAAKHGSKQADAEHPYGHGRIETVASVLLGSILIFVSGGIIYDALMRIQDPARLAQPTYVAFFVALLSVLIKEGMYQYTVRLARRIRSSVVHANAWHHRSDAMSSVIASFGILGAVFGMTLLDALAAIVVSVFIARIGWKIAWNAFQELIDTGFEKDKLQQLEEAILSTDGILAIHSLRTRSHGGQGFVDVHVLVDDPKISVSEGHRIGESVYQRLTNNFDFVSDVVVHVDPEDDERHTPSMDLPLRSVVTHDLEQNWKEFAFYTNIRRITLHYVDGKIQIEVLFPLSVLTQYKSDEIQTKLVSALPSDKYFGEIFVLFA